MKVTHLIVNCDELNNLMKRTACNHVMSAHPFYERTDVTSADWGKWYDDMVENDVVYPQASESDEDYYAVAEEFESVALCLALKNHYNLLCDFYTSLNREYCTASHDIVFGHKKLRYKKRLQNVVNQIAHMEAQKQKHPEAGDGSLFHKKLARLSALESKLRDLISA